MTISLSVISVEQEFPLHWLPKLSGWYNLGEVKKKKDLGEVWLQGFAGEFFRLSLLLLLLLVQKSRYGNSTVA